MPDDLATAFSQCPELVLLPISDPYSAAEQALDSAHTGPVQHPTAIAQKADSPMVPTSTYPPTGFVPRPGSFRPTPRHAWRQAVVRLPVTSSWRVVYVYLAERANPDGTNAWAGIDHLTETLRLAPATVKRALRFARKTGWLTLEAAGRKNKTVSSYALTFPRWWLEARGLAVPDPEPEPSDEFF